MQSRRPLSLLLDLSFASTHSFLSLVQRINRQLKTYRLALVAHRPRIKKAAGPSPSWYVLHLFQFCFAVLVSTDYIVVLLRILVLQM